jgi:hypothetical protein
MQIDELLKASFTPSKVDLETYTLHGLIAPDTDPELVRVYRNPRNKKSYWLINKTFCYGRSLFLDSRGCGISW